MTNGYFTVANTKEVLLGIAVDEDLKFDGYVSILFKKACQKLNALVCFHHILTLKKEGYNDENIYRVLVWILSLRLDVP